VRRPSDRLRRRRGRVAVAHVDLDLAAAQAGGDLDLGQRHAVGLDLTQALGDLRLRHAEHPQRVAVQRRRPRQQLAQRRGLQRRRPHRLKLARRPGQDDDDAPVGRHDEPRSGADRVQHERPLRRHRLLAVGLAQRLGVEAHHPRTAGKAAQDRRDLLLDLLIEDHLAAREAPHHLCREVVGGRPQPP